MRALDNPFATGRLERVLAFDPALIGSSWEALEARWERLGRHACIRGHHGAGKTTLLEAMAARLARRGPVLRLFFNRDCRRLGGDAARRLARVAGSVLVVDGEDHLSWRERGRVRAAAAESAGFLSARHRAGGGPTLIELRSDPRLARRLLERAAPEWVGRLGPGLERDWRRHRGNLRELWLDCYDRLAREPEKLF